MSSSTISALDGNPTSNGYTLNGWVRVVEKDGQFQVQARELILPDPIIFQVEGESVAKASRYSVQIGEGTHIDLGRNEILEKIIERY